MAGAWRQESGGGSVGKFLYSIFSENLFSKNVFYSMIQTVSFFTLAWKCGERSDYLVCILFFDYIFLLGQEHEDGSMGA